MNLKACCGLLATRESDDVDHDYEDMEHQHLPKPGTAVAPGVRKRVSFQTFFLLWFNNVAPSAFTECLLVTFNTFISNQTNRTTVRQPSGALFFSFCLSSLLGPWTMGSGRSFIASAAFPTNLLTYTNNAHTRAHQRDMAPVV